MNNKRELLIVQDVQSDWKEGEHEVWHPLYLDGYKAGVRNIFTKAYDIDIKRDNENYKRFIRDEQNNILSFIGKRGSGKTTAMDEFCRILDSMDKEKESSWWMEQTVSSEVCDRLRNRRFKFHILQPIDASLFDESGDLFEQIIANLYRYFDKMTKNEYRDSNDGVCTEKNSYEGKYTDIMKSYYSDIGNKSNRSSAFSIANMISFASDNNEIQEKIINLIDAYLNDRKCDYEYIVITIDDIDLNIGLGYRMLEQIQKYFAYRKIIILVSMDYDQMRMVCEKHFWKCLGGDNKINSEKYNQQYIKNLTKDIMTKIFHISQRIYLPELTAILKDTYVSENQNRKEKTIKGYIINKIVNKLQIYYDLCGLKRHFVEPDTIREFVVYMDFLNSLNDVDMVQMEIEPEKNLRVYDANYKLFSNDIVERMAQNLLSAEQMLAFRKLRSHDVERRVKYFVNSYIDDNGNIIFGSIDAPLQTSLLRLNRTQKVFKAEYSYGDLLEQIYEWGRKPGRDCFEDKPYIWCVLAMFTTDMTKTYMHFKYDADMTDKDDLKNNQPNYKKQLLGFIGESFENEWLKASFPKVRYAPLIYNSMKELVNEESMGSKFINYDLNKNYSILNLKISISDKMLKEYFSDNNQIKECIYDMGIIQTMAVIDMCFSKIINGEIKRIEFTVEEDAEGLYVGVKNNCDVKLDMMSFAIKSVEYKKCQDALIKNIKEVLGKILDHMDCRNIDRKSIKNDSFIKKCLPFDYIGKESKFLYFPFYDLDLSYNVLKRVRKELVSIQNPAPDLFNAMKMFYGKIAEHLQDEDEKYERLGMNIPGFTENYKKCPFIKAILGDEKTKMIKKATDNFERILEKMILTPGGDAGVAPAQNTEE